MSDQSGIADRNLLVGILALQLDLISRDELITAMNAWVLSKDRSLEQVLVEQHVLTTEEQTLLSALLVKHLEKHSNDLKQSLAAVSSVASSVRVQLQSLDDEDVEASLGILATAGQAEEAHYEDEIADTLTLVKSAEEVTRFRVLRPHAKGGLGEVFVASDEELNREVALKRIQRSHADNPDSRARFLLEAELTGRLEHPGIVPVYGLGQYADGRPFYAMRFIRGDSLKEAITQFHRPGAADADPSERVLQLRKLLGRFIDICDAVEYAHSRGVLHRDLKPSNVMLGKYGETLVVDWGLAKLIDRKEVASPSEEPSLRPASGSASEQTRMGAAIGTPAYMSPEQAGGRLDLLGVGSDVYSLGATLYALLTGKAPVEDEDLASTLHKVERGEFSRPSEVAANVSPALEAICLKAMALEPKSRYLSPRALADDVEHWLADEPVSAYRDPWLARAGRWARRNRSLVAGLTGLLLTAVVSLSIGAVLLTGANRRIHKAQELAVSNEQTAKENFRLARLAVDAYLTTVSQEVLLDEPGMQPLRKKLLAEALVYYQTFVEKSSDDPQLQLELRDAHLLVGTITTQIGSHSEALKAFRTALEINERLVRRDPESIPLQFKLARCHIAIGNAHSDVGDLPAAKAAFENAIALLKAVLKSAPENVPTIAELISTYNSLGALQSDLGQSTEATSCYELAFELFDDLKPAEDDKGEYRNKHAATCHNLGMLHHETGDQQAAIENYVAAIQIREELVEQFPKDQTFQSKLSLSYNNLANVYAHIGRLKESVQQHAKAIEIRELLVEENPAVTAYHDLLAGSYSNLSSYQRRLGNVEAAAELGRKATAIWVRLAEKHPGIVDYRASLALSYFNLGNLFLGNPATDAANWDDATKKQRMSDAVQNYEKSIKQYEALVSEFPTVPEYQSDLASAYNNCGSAYSLTDDDARSRELNDLSLALRERIVERFPQVPDYRNELASTYSNLAGDEKDKTKRDAMLDKSVALRQALVDEFPDVPNYREKLAFSLMGYALQQFVAGDQQEALPKFQRIIALMERLQAESPEVPNYRATLVQALQLYAAGQRLSGDWKQAAETEEKIEKFFAQLLADDPGNISYTVGMARGIYGQGTCFQKGNNNQQAAHHYTRAIDLLQPIAQAEKPDRVALSTYASALEMRIIVRERLEQYDGAVEDSERMMQLSKSPRKWILKRARLHCLAGEHAAATSAAAKIIKEGDMLTTAEFYTSACIFGLAVAATEDDGDLDENTRKEIIDGYAEKALHCLREAHAAGFFKTPAEIEHLAKDSDLDPIRGRSEYRDFVKQLTPAAATADPPADK